MANIPFLNNAYFSAKVGIGTAANSAEETNNGIPRLQVTTATAVLGEFPLAARFTTASDAGDNSGVSVLINSGNDRGLMISAGRAVGNRTRATLNLVSFDGNELVDGLTFYMPNTGSTGSTTGTNVGIGTTSPLTKLHIAGTTDDNIIRIENTSTALSAGDTIGAIQFFNNDPTDDSPNVAASIYATAGASGGSGSLRFKTIEPGVEGDPATDAMIITNAGKVGIGTDSPTSNLDIFSTGTSTLTLSYDGGGGTGSTIDFSLINAGVSQPITTQIKAIDDGAYRQNLSFLTKTSATGASTLSTRMIILAGGNVGIGTTSPGAKLNVAGDILIDSGEYISWGTVGATSIEGSTASNKLQFRTDSSDRMIIDSLGNVGIGTTSPSASHKLDVNGAGRFSGNVTSTGNISARSFDMNSTYDSSNQYLQLHKNQANDGGILLRSRTTAGAGQVDWQIVNQGTTGDLKFYAYGLADYAFVLDRETGNLQLPEYGAGTLVSDASGNITVSSGGGAGGPYLPLAGGTMTGALVIGYSDARLRGGDSTGRFIVSNSDTTSYISLNGSSNASPNDISIITDEEILFLTGAGYSEAMRIDQDGNVGIGTTSPDYRLDVAGSANNADIGIRINNTFDDNNPASEPNAVLFLNAASNNGYLRVHGAPANTAAKHQIDLGSTAGSSFLTFSPGNAERMRIATDGAIQFNDYGAGILVTDASGNITAEGGTWNGPYLPLAGGTMTGDLFIEGASTPKITITDTTNNLEGRIRVANNYMYIEADNSDAVVSTRILLKTDGVAALTLDGNQNATFAGAIVIDSALLSNQENTDVDTGTETVANVAIATYTAAFFDFVVKKGTNVRSGTVYACHDGTNVEFTETSTNDLGDTSDVTLSVDISGTNMRLLATVTSDDWSVKSLIRAI